jgi:Protein of unknown function (DUF402)
VRWQPGDVVALREIWKGRVWKARAARVVEDAPERVVLWFARGGQTMIPDGSGIPRDEWTLGPGRFRSSALKIARPGAWHSILHFHRDGSWAESWYVNLERPLRRSRVGFDYLDLELDLLAWPGGRWELLDEDEFEESQRLGVTAAAEAAEVRLEAARVVETWPFPTGWEGWEPEPGWEPPLLPAGWDAVPPAPHDPADLPALAAAWGLPWREAEARLAAELERAALTPS